MKLLLYCNKSRIRLFFDKLKEIFTLGKIPSNNDLNGKIVAECDFDVEEFDYMKPSCIFTPTYLSLLEQSCLTDKEMFDYLKGKNGYAIHIKNLHIFDEPRELKDLEPKREIHKCIHGNFIIDEELEIPIKAPQNMMYVYDSQGTKYILISIRPEWLCKILNGEKTIEIRKKILKEML